MDLRIDTSLSSLELLALPVFTPYSARHLKKEGFLNKLIGAVELVPGISLVATAIEYLAQRFFSKEASLPIPNSPFIELAYVSLNCENCP